VIDIPVLQDRRFRIRRGYAGKNMALNIAARLVRIRRNNLNHK
jgi:hypothetical protein